MDAQLIARWWSALDSLPGGVASVAEWRLLLGADVVEDFPFLQLTGERATSIPHPTDRWTSYRIVVHGPGDVVGVDDENDESVPVDEREIRVYRADWRRLFSAVALAFGATPVDSKSAGPLLRAGYFRTSGRDIPLIFAMPSPWVSERLLEFIAAPRNVPFVLAAPSRRTFSSFLESVVSDTRSELVALDEELTSYDSAAARFVAREIRLPSVEPQMDAPLEQRAGEVMAAMLYLGATHPDKSRIADIIAVEAYGPTGEGNSIKHLMSSLKRRGLVDSKRGNGGGAWLTEAGVRRIQAYARSLLKKV